jgi:hypothetical protein
MLSQPQPTKRVFETPCWPLVLLMELHCTIVMKQLFL